MDILRGQYRLDGVAPLCLTISNFLMRYNDDADNIENVENV
jgi:hypothetical protein